MNYDTELKIGDRVLAVDGNPTTTWEALAQTVRDSKGAPLALTVEREGGQLSLTVTPKLRDARSVFGEDKGQVYLIGIEASHDWEAVGPLRAVTMAGQQTATATYLVVQGLVMMVQGRVPLKELGGPIAIARAAGQQARAGARYFLSMLAFLSINLGVLNLLPIPILDGGQIVFQLVEWLKGSPLSERAQAFGQQVGIALLILLMGVALFNDIARQLT